MVFREELKDILRRYEACALVQLKIGIREAGQLLSAHLGAVTGEAVVEYSFDLLISPYIYGVVCSTSTVLEVTSVSETGLSRHNSSFNLKSNFKC